MRHSSRFFIAVVAAASLSLGAVRANATEIVHVVVKGQTLGAIAKRYRSSVDAIREVNNLRPGERIHPGLSLVIPQKEAPTLVSSATNTKLAKPAVEPSYMKRPK